ncbi:hypothetical protein CBR_g55043 [Chara braunii]|uniref:Uncharacterized protein n=1 Tax=Chara braunii TaxID=69332 RepID=A0A388MCI3_CHABU|nr:hypothetical protein CBR_g55043 [Chara braunii]|eukprot:GBG92274.1 hypothetical protein CBR_g55043 [Chara braunii]
MRPTCVTDVWGAVNVVPLGTVVLCAKTPGGLLKLHTNGMYDECGLPIRGVTGVLVTIKSFTGYGSNMPLCSHFKGLYDGGSKRLPSPEQYLDLALMVPRERPVLPPEHIFQLLPPRDGSSGLAQETPGTAVGRGSPIQDAGGRVKGRSVHTQVGPDAPKNTSDLHSLGTGTQRVGTPKLIKVHYGANTYSLRDETRRDSGISGLDVGGNEAEGMGAVRESSGREQTPSEKKSERQRMVREEVAEGALRMKRMRGKPEAVMGGDGGGDGERASGKRPTKEEGGTASKKVRRPGGLTIREGHAAGGGDSADPGAAAAREPLGKSKRKVAAEEGDGEKKTRRRKTVEAASGGEGPVGKEYDEAAAFWLEYERNDVGEIMEKELPFQLLIDPRKSKSRNCGRHQGYMLSQFREKKGKIWTKNPLVLAAIYKSVTRRPEKADKIHKDVFKREDKDKYYYYPVNGQHTVAAVKELEGEQIFNLWKMHSWPARVVWFSDRDFAGYRQVSLNENTRHKMSKQRSQKAAFLDMREAWENEGRPMAIQGNPSGKEAEKQKFFDFQKLILGKSPNGAHWTLAQKDSSLADKEYVAAVRNALRQWMPLMTAGDDVFRKAMEFYAKWAEGKLLGGDGKTPLSRSGKYMPDKSPGLQAIPEMGSKGAVGETKIRWLVRVRPPPTKKKTQADDKVFVVVKEPDMFCWQYLADMTDVKKLSILDDILALRGVFVQSAGGNLKRQHKPGIKDIVATRKVDRVMLCMFHYILFLETEENERFWRHGSPFFRTEGKLLEEFGPQGLTKQVWVKMRKHFQGAVEYVNTCKRSFPHEKESIDDAKRLYDDDRFPKSFEKSVRSILRRTEEEVRDTIRTLLLRQASPVHVGGCLGTQRRLHPRIFPPAVRNGIWVMAIKEADGKWSGLKRLGAGAFKRKARTALVEHLSLMNPERNDQDIDAYAEQKLHELYANNMLEFRAPFYAHETAPSRGIDWRMPQPPPASQHPGGGGGGDDGDGGGGGGDDSQFAGKGTGETSSVEKASGGKGSGRKRSGGKGSGGKGSGGKRRTSGSPQYMETDLHCVGSRDSDMRDEATLTSDQVRVDLHLSARSLYPVAQESPSRRAQQRSLVLNTLLLKEDASSFCLEGGMPALRRSEGATSGSLGSGDRHKLRIHSDLLPSPYAKSAPHATVPRGQENVTSWPPHLQLDTGLPCSPPFSCVETRDWRSRDVLEGPLQECWRPGVARTNVTLLGKTSALRKRVLYIGKRRINVGCLAKCWRPGIASVNVMLRRWLHARALVIGTSKEVLHSRLAVATTREGVVKGGKWTSVQAPFLGDDEDEEEPAVEARVHGDEKGGEPVVEGGEVIVDIRTDPQRKDGDSSPTRCGEEQGGRASVLSTAGGMVLHEAIELGDDSAATELVNDSGVAEMQNIQSSVEGGEVAVSIKMDPERKDYDSPSTRCGAEQGD